MIISRPPTEAEIVDAQRRGWDGILWIDEVVPDTASSKSLEEQIQDLVEEAA